MGQVLMKEKYSEQINYLDILHSDSKGWITKAEINCGGPTVRSADDYSRYFCLLHMAELGVWHVPLDSRLGNIVG